MKNKYTGHLLLFSLLLPLLNFAQVLTGTVVDENGQPLPGAGVLVVEQQTGANTDMDGRFIGSS
jgi:hypothetical protein